MLYSSNSAEFNGATTNLLTKAESPSLLLKAPFNCSSEIVILYLCLKFSETYFTFTLLIGYFPINEPASEVSLLNLSLKFLALIKSTNTISIDLP